MEIIGIAGGKAAGKDSAAKVITGMVLKKIGMILDFDITQDGDLIIDRQESVDGTFKRSKDILYLDRHDERTLTLLNEFIWPHTKTYHFADSLKYILVNMFQFDENVLFGSQADKESPSRIKWENMIDVIPKKLLKKNIVLDNYMTHREVMQHFADIMRTIDVNCFTNHCMEQIFREQSPISIVADVRIREEAQAIKDAGGKVIYLTRRLHTQESDSHRFENGFSADDMSMFDIIIDNQNMTIGEKSVKLVNALKDIGFLQ